VDVRFDPKGDALYVADFGSLVMQQEKAKPIPGTGVIWRVVRQNANITTPPANLQAADFRAEE